MYRFKFLAIFVLLISCLDDSSPGPDDCPENIACTLEYRSYSVFISSDGAPVVLDSIYTENVVLGTQHKFADNLPNDGYYTIISDGQFNDVFQSGSEFVLKGFVGRQQIVNQPYIFGHDCCHVIKIEGPETIEL